MGALHIHEAGVGKAAEAPVEFRKLVEFMSAHRAWTLMNKPDGSFFSTIEEFCQHARPHGWGHPWAELEPVLDAAAATMTEETPAGPVPVDGGNVVLRTIEIGQ